MARTPELDELVTSKERTYYMLLVGVSVIVYAAIAYALLASAEAATAMGGAAVYVVFIALAIFMTRGLMMGRLRGNGIRVSERQFPALYEIAKRHARALDLNSLPHIFVLESGGALNAFATRFLGRDFVIVYSDVLALAEERGQAAVGFIIAHELAHLKRGHLKRRWLTLPGRMMPYLGTAYSRACEYTCDQFGAFCQPDGAVDALLVLASGRELYRQVSAREYARQVETERGFFVRRAELFSTHPRLPKRLAALMKQGVQAPSYSPIAEARERVTASR